MVTNMTHRIIRRSDTASQNTSNLTPILSNTRSPVSAASGNRLLSQEQQQRCHPNEYIWKKLEMLIEKLQCEETGIPVGTVKSLMSTVPSVFMGSELISWMIRHLDVDDTTEASHVSCMIAAFGYILPVDEHVLSVKNDHTFYRFQTPCLWPSKSGEPENTDYAVYLCKRTMQNKQRLELADYEAENLARLQRLFSHKWEFIYLQAEAEAKVDKKRDKVERLVLESQERAFWDLHRPAPGCVNTTELDMRKLCRAKRPKKPPKRPANFPLPSGEVNFPSDSVIPLETQVTVLRSAVSKGHIKVSKAAENLMNFYSQYSEFDPLLRCLQETTSPWVSDNCEFWEQERRLRDLPIRRVKRWRYGIHELLRDPAGREEFQRWLEKEFSAENLRFWDACQRLKSLPLREVGKTVTQIFEEYLSPSATDPVNVDCRVAEIVRKRVTAGGVPDRFCFEEAEDHIFQLMKSDSYHRFLRSDVYNDMLAGQKKKSKKRQAGSEVRQKVDIHND